MTPFLKKVSAHIIENYSNDLDKTLIVLPNQRAKAFIHSYFLDIVNKPLLLPGIFSIEDFVCKITGLEIGTHLELITTLYSAYKDVEKEHAESFDEFLQWGHVLLNDINDIDKNLVDAKKVFNYLSDAKAISQWDPQKKQLTDFQKKYLHFYRSLFKYYQEFIQKISNKQVVHQGYAFKKVVETLANRTLGYEKVVFAGFNAFSNSEQKIIKLLREQGKLDLLWDTDKYYINDKYQEAGIFLKKHMQKFVPFRWVEDNFSYASKKIYTRGTAKNINQAKITANILSYLKEQNALQIPEKTAIILADENLLMPVLHSLPGFVEKVNVTMGYPLKNTLLYDLCQVVIGLHENAQRLNETRQVKDGYFYYNDLLKLLTHPYIKNYIFPGSTNQASELAEKIALSKRVFWDLELLNSYTGSEDTNAFETLSILLEKGKNPVEQILKSLDTISAKLYEVFNSNETGVNHKIEKEYLFHLSGILNNLSDFFQDSGIKKVSTLKSLFRQVVNQSKVPFEGIPLEGLQIMGLLETRNLDFENIILTGANEGILPAAKSQNTFIPLDIKKEFDLQTYADRDAIYAYHFYRMIQRAKNVFILYNTEPGELGTGEKSRFVSQLLHEMPIYNPKIYIDEAIETLPLKEITPENSIEINKSPEILEQLKTLGAKGFSPTTLTRYINCSLMFYFEKIAGLKEPETLEETIEANTLGTVAHDVLEKLYTPYKNIQLNPHIVKGFIDQLDKLVEETFKEKYKNGQLSYGKNLLITKVVKKFLLNFLHKEIQYLKQDHSITIKYAEEELHHPIRIKVNNEEIHAKVKGTADRVDETDGYTRIIDYKTGKVEKSELKVHDWEKLLEGKQFNKSFQILTYAFLFFKNKPQNGALFPGIVSFKNLSQGILYCEMPGNKKQVDQSAVEDFQVILEKLFSAIFDKNIPFTQTDDKDNCQYCPYKSICNR